MKRLLRGLMLGASMLMATVQAASLPAMVVVTEDARPLHYVWQGQLQGEAPPLIDLLLQEAGIHYSQQVYPWARAYMMASSLPNVLIYSIARTPEREAQFHWVGKLLTVQYAMYALQTRQDIRARTVEDLHNYRLGVTANDVRANWLREQGIREVSPDNRTGMDVTHNGLSNMRKLLQGRVDMVPTSAVGLRSFCLTENIDCSRFRRVMVLPFSVDLYVAASLQTPRPVVQALRGAYDRINRNGSYQRLMAPYIDGASVALVR